MVSCDMLSFKIRVDLSVVITVSNISWALYWVYSLAHELRCMSKFINFNSNSFQFKSMGCITLICASIALPRYPDILFLFKACWCNRISNLGQWSIFVEQNVPNQLEGENYAGVNCVSQIMIGSYDWCLYTVENRLSDLQLYKLFNNPIILVPVDQKGAFGLTDYCNGC